MAPLAKGILALIGNTPLVRLNRLVPDGSAEIWCKLEAVNPSGSVKDRAVLAMIEDAESQGLLKRGGTVVEATAGNTGVSLAMICAAKGYRLILTMPDGVSLERRRLLGRYGAQLVLTPIEEGMAGAIKAIRELVRTNPEYFVLGQFENPANPKAHRETTAVEIWNDTSGRIDAFVAGVGTGGTITGVGEFLKAKDPSILVVAVEPASSPVLSEGRPREHRIPGIGPDFVPPNLNRRVIDRIVQVKDEEAYNTASQLSRQEGLLVGPSSGANVYAALKLAEELGAGKVVVTILPDGGERYINVAMESS